MRVWRNELNRHLVSFLDPTSFEAEQYRRLRQRVEELGALRRAQVLAVTSPVAGDGKTLTAANLAGALARRQDARILLVDADLRQPSVALLLGMKCQGGGIEAALQREAGPWKSFVETAQRHRVAVLPCARSCQDPYELLTSVRFGQLLAGARLEYDYIIVDTPPLIPVPDATLVRTVVDGYLVVVAANRTPRKLVAEALNLLTPESVLGLVFNRDDRPLFGYYDKYCEEYFGAYVGSLGKGRG